MRLRIRWLAAWPGWRAVRPSIAERARLRVRVCAACGRTFIGRNALTKSAAS